MNYILSHFDLTPKSVGAFALAGLAMLASFHFLTVPQAETVGVFVTAGLAMLRPSRKPDASKPPQDTNV